VVRSEALSSNPSATKKKKKKNKRKKISISQNEIPGPATSTYLTDLLEMQNIWFQSRPVESEVMKVGLSSCFNKLSR
jgi:hypothetical protein